MKCRIIKIKGCKTCKEILLSIVRVPDENDYLEISAWHESKEGEHFYQIENVECDNSGILEHIIEDYSEFSANQFANSFKM